MKSQNQHLISDSEKSLEAQNQISEDGIMELMFANDVPNSLNY